jgi:hypothetical protein
LRKLILLHGNGAALACSAFARPLAVNLHSLSIAAAAALAGLSF